MFLRFGATRYLNILFVLTFIGCKKSDTLFTKLGAGDTNINFQNTLFDDGPLNVANYIYFYNGGGVAVGDINNDGLSDVFFTGNMVKNRLFINKGDMQFEDITTNSGVADKQGWCTGATMADVNGDGWLDIYICRSADINPEMRKNLLFINNGSQNPSSKVRGAVTFTEKATEYGLADIGYSTQAGFFDFDKDGDLDCFINNHSLQKYTAGIQDDPSIRKDRDPLYASKLYRNDKGHYTDISIEAGIKSNVLTFGLGMAISDMNNDGWPDIYVSNDFNEQDYYFVNDKKGGFSEQLANTFDQVSLYSMGNDAADYNNDGLVDLLTLDMQPEDNKTQKMHSGAENFDKFQLLFSKGYYYQYSRNMLQKNNGDGTFSEVGQLANVSNTDWSWASLFCDFDNDGYKDLFVTNGYVKDYSDMDFLKYSVDRVIKKESNDPESMKAYIAKMPSNKIPNYVLQNDKGNTFIKKTKDWGLDDPLFSYGAAYADLDNDGDMDLVVNNSNDLASIYQNNSREQGKGNFIKLKLQGQNQNPSGIGAKVTVYSGGNKYFQELFPVRGFQSTVEPILNFGLGQNTTIDSLIVIWPNDNCQKLKKVKANRSLTLLEIDAKENWNYNQQVSKAIFKESTGPTYTHTENGFNDFTVQSLLPHYLSRKGPCMAKADVNNDGMEDLYIGGASGQAGALFLQSKSGSFTKKTLPAFDADMASEDVAAEFFDADNNGYIDLYVGSGTYEFASNDPRQQDRLYLNDGKGNFTKASNALPKNELSTGTVKAADIDNDGDQDLFVGGRVLPGQYPAAPPSALFMNDGKAHFTDVTDKLAPEIKNIGMVTDALWIDLNKDNRQDILIVGEWMPIKVFINEKAGFKDQSANYIKFESAGWWNKIVAEDFDADGDKDLILSNLGLNTQFKVSAQEPLSVYYKDFEIRGSFNPILCYYIEGISYPAASRDDLVDQMPSLKKKFLEYKTYATATITDVFTSEQLEGAGLLKAGMMHSIYLQNDSKNGFSQKTLPIETQYAPVYAMTTLDANHDGKLDVVMAGNDFHCRIKFGRYTANHGVLLLGDGKGNFSYQSQAKAGLNIRGEAKSLLNTNNKLLLGLNNEAVKAYSY